MLEYIRKVSKGGDFTEEQNIKTYVVIKHKYDNKSGGTNVHVHDFYQLMYIAAGEGNVKVSNESLRVKPGDVIFIAPMVEHGVDFANTSMTTYEIKFDIFDNELEEIARNIGVLYYEEDNKIKNLILKIIDESTECRPYYKKSVENFISQIIIYLTRQKSLASDSESVINISYEGHSSIASKIKTYIDFNYSKKVSLVELAEIFCISQSHLCREFTKNFGMSPIKYLNNLRIEKAKELLSISDYSIGEIAYRVGFNDIHYFSRYFTKQEKISPVSYRRKIRDVLVIQIN